MVATVKRGKSKQVKGKTRFSQEWSKKAYDSLRSAPIMPQIPMYEEMELLQASDISRSDNFYSVTYPALKNNRRVLKKEAKYEELLEVDKQFFKLMDMGYAKRRYIEVQEDVPDGVSFIEIASRSTKDYFEIERTKEEQFAELKEIKLKERSGIFQKMLPEQGQKYVNYLKSLRIKPTPADSLKNAIISCFFSFVVWANSSARSSFMYLVIGKLALISILLSRNMPGREKEKIGGPRRKAATWSSNAFNTAVSIAALTTLGSAGVTAIFTSIIPYKMSGNAKFKLGMITSLLATGYFTQFFEVFEEKDKNGWRWKKAMDEALPEDEQAKLREQIFGKKKFTEQYDYEYNPMIDDFPPAPKYIDGDEPLTSEEEVEQAAFDKFVQERKDARKPPVISAPPDAPGFGGKSDLYPETIPKWLQLAYKKTALARNKWSKEPQKFDRTIVEKTVVEGPLGFRDKKPEWLTELFSGTIWEDKIGVSRAAARAFGSYRKTMWKIDPKVVLQSSDV